MSFKLTAKWNCQNKAFPAIGSHGTLSLFYWVWSLMRWHYFRVDRSPIQSWQFSLYLFYYFNRTFETVETINFRLVLLVSFSPELVDVEDSRKASFVIVNCNQPIFVEDEQVQAGRLVHAVVVVLAHWPLHVTGDVDGPQVLTRLHVEQQKLLWVAGCQKCLKSEKDFLLNIIM